MTYFSPQNEECRIESSVPVQWRVIWYVPGVTLAIRVVQLAICRYAVAILSRLCFFYNRNPFIGRMKRNFSDDPHIFGVNDKHCPMWAEFRNLRWRSPDQNSSTSVSSHACRCRRRYKFQWLIRFNGSTSGAVTQPFNKVWPLLSHN